MYFGLIFETAFLKPQKKRNHEKNNCTFSRYRNI